MVEQVVLTEDKRLQWRTRALKDLYWFAGVILNYGDRVPIREGPHALFCKFVEKRTGHPALDTARYRKIELPREFGKTTLVTQAYAIQRICANPEIAILIANEKEQNAKDFLSEIKHQFETNELLRALFPEIVPQDFSETTWSASRIIVQRQTGRKEPTVSVIGVGGTVTGMHYDLIICDDIISRSAMENARAGSWQIMHEVNRWIHQLEPLLNSNAEPFPEVIFIGTRWWHKDSYEHIEDAFGYGDAKRPFLLRWKDSQTGEVQQITAFRQGDLAMFRRAAIEDGHSTFPEKWDLEKLAKIRVRDESLFACFPPEQRILTARGAIPIAEVQRGDEVRDQCGFWYEVRRTFAQPWDTPLHTIRAWGAAEPITATHDHKLLASKSVRYRRKFVTPSNIQHLVDGGGRHVTRVLPAVKWIAAEDIAVGDVLWTPLPREEIWPWPEQWPDELCHPDAWFLIGHWVGDGFISTNKLYPRSHSIGHVFNHKDVALIERIRTIIQRLLHRKGGLYRDATVTRVGYGHAALGAFLKAARIGGNSQKLLPPWVETIPRDCLRSLVDGYWSADGCETKGRLIATSVCLPWLEQLQRILARLGEASYVARTGVNHVRGCRIHAKIYPAQRLYSLTTYASRRSRKAWIDGEYFCRRVRAVGTTEYHGSVFTLEAEGSYTLLGNIVAKNCNYLNNPSDEITATFRESWLLYYEMLDDETYRLTDGTGAKRTYALRDLDRLLFVDPGGFGSRATEDRARAAIVAVGSSTHGEHLLLDCYSEKETFLACAEKIGEWAARYSPRKIVIELAGQQLAFIEFTKKLLNEKGLQVTVEAVKPGTTAKEQRILLLEPLFQQGRMFIGRGPNMHELRSQYSHFPRAARIDLLDALAYFPAFAKKQPRSPTDASKRRADELAAYYLSRGLPQPS